MPWGGSDGSSTQRSHMYLPDTRYAVWRVILQRPFWQQRPRLLHRAVLSPLRPLFRLHDQWQQHRRQPSGLAVRHLDWRRAGVLVPHRRDCHRGCQLLGHAVRRRSGPQLLRVAQPKRVLARASYLWSVLGVSRLEQRGRGSGARERRGRGRARERRERGEHADVVGIR